MSSTRAVAIDLAFTPAEEQLIQAGKGIGAQERLSQGDVWESTLRLWLQHLIADGGDSAPAELQSCEEICLGLQFVDDAQITDLNARWRNKPTATDVLSFSALEADMPLDNCPSLELGDIIVSVPTAERQALEQEHSLERELCWLVSHGLLHLLGWDHPDESRLEAMLQCQEQLVAMAGIVQSHGEINCESADEITEET
ncbi:rRNA maturation RNase YbeY [Synechococcus sp. UW179A]|uniref:rRNA maturation RNase YbeY n=1 Tax=Synechococcus sp. UW179A TaxID=2575510 RepID=UPI000E0F45D3|nr:rRNA maturation RNase YbeY [Synechococcus sp. UW179A]